MGPTFRFATMRLVPAAALAVVLAVTARDADAQTKSPARSQGWRTTSNVFVILGASSQLVMPRVYHAESETTIGWKARWHVSVLAPVMTMTTATLASEYVFKPDIGGDRPGCDETNRGMPGCTTFGAPSTHAFASFSALGHGAGVFIVDTLKWNNGRFHSGAFVGDVAVPLVSAVFTAVGRVAGSSGHESGGQVMAGAGLGIGFGLLGGVAYSLLQRPECGYNAGLVCW